MPSLAAELRAAALAQIAWKWRDLNGYLFGEQMRQPLFELLPGDSSSGGPLGRWRSVDRTIGISESLLAERSWVEVAEVLKHEMAHQFVDEVLGADEPPHGPAFRRICRERGVDPSASGLPAVDGARDPAQIRALRRVRRLLALAESDNPHEARAAANAAHRLMRRYNIERAADPGAGRYAFRQLGPVRGRFPAHEKLLVGLLCDHFFVDGIWVDGYDAGRAKRGRVFQAMGTPENLEIAAHVYDFALAAAERAWRDHKRARQIRGDRDRQRFLAGVMTGLRSTLRAQGRACEQEGLVWVGDAGLADYIGRRFPRVRAGRGVRLQGRAVADGHAAGREIVIHRAVGGRAVERGRLLE